MQWAVFLVLLMLPWLYGLNAPFVYDDVGMIQDNPFLDEPANFIKTLRGGTLMDADIVNGRRPVVLLSYFIDRWLYGLQPIGYRVTNLFWHLACAGILMALWRRLGASAFLAVAAGLFFAWHPIVSEPVHAPGFRADILCLFFTVAALHCFIGPAFRKWRIAAGIGCFLLALLSKETGQITPWLLLLLMACFPSHFPEWKTGWRYVAGLACVGVLVFVLWLVSAAPLQAAGTSVWNGESLRFPENLYSAPSLWARTLRLVLVPWPLNVTPAFTPVATPWSAAFAAGLFWIAMAMAAIWYFRKPAPWLSLGMGWMLIAFLPSSNLWPLLHPVADRYFYPIVPGFALMAAWLFAQQSRRGRCWGVGLLAGIYVCLLWLRLWQWETPEKLWSAAYYQNQNSATAATWLGLLRQHDGDDDGALTFYHAAITVNPQDTTGWINAGIIEGRRGNWAESEKLLRRATEINPANPKAWRNLATCLAAQERADEARTAAERAIQ